MAAINASYGCRTLVITREILEASGIKKDGEREFNGCVAIEQSVK